MTPAKRSYIHLNDAGLADNSGTASVLQALGTKGCPWSITRKMNQGRIKNLLVITVDSRIVPDRTWDQQGSRPGMFDVALNALDGPVHNSVAGWSARLKNAMDRLAVQLARNDRFAAVPPMPTGSAGPQGVTGEEVAPTARRCYMVEVAFDHIADEDTRHFCDNVLTRLSHPDETIDRLTEIGARLLRKSPDYQALVTALDGTIDLTGV